MNNLMEYKNFIGSVEFSEVDGLFYGKVQGINDLVSYEGTNAKELLDDFHNSIDDYISLCEKNGNKLEKVYNGNYLNIDSNLQKDIDILISLMNTSVNKLICESIFDKIKLNSNLKFDDEIDRINDELNKYEIFAKKYLFEDRLQSSL